MQNTYLPGYPPHAMSYCQIHQEWILERSASIETYTKMAATIDIGSGNTHLGFPKST